jgi:hypothetical protein
LGGGRIEGRSKAGSRRSAIDKGRTRTKERKNQNAGNAYSDLIQLLTLMAGASSRRSVLRIKPFIIFDPLKRFRTLITSATDEKGMRFNAAAVPATVIHKITCLKTTVKNGKVTRRRKARRPAATTTIRVFGKKDA